VGHKELAAFLQRLKTEKRFSPHTVAAYQRDLNALLGFCEREGIESFRALDAQAVRRFAAESHRKGLGPRSVARRLSAVRSFLNYLVEVNEIAANQAVHVQAPKAPRRLPPTLDADQVASLLEISGEGALTVRDRAMLELFYSSGLRLAELVGLDLTDVDLVDRTVRVVGKGSKSRIVPVGRHAITALNDWLRVRAELAPAGQPALFVSRARCSCG
jgi:integrase/recombinase XerC